MNNSKKSLLMSSISLLLCISMFIGSTFAWFTDSASSAGNKIHSGILKLDVELLDKETQKWHSIKDTQEPLFNYDKWEPGYMDAKVFKIQNEGNLALKWVTKFYSEYELSILSDVIDIYVRPSDSKIGYPTDRNLENYTCVGNLRTFINSIEDTTYGNLEPEQESYLGIVLKMREEAGNEYQGLSLGGPFDIRIYATQYTSEYDSFGKEYDKGATFDELSNTSIMATASNTLVAGANSVDFDLSNNGLYVAKVIVPASAIADPAQPVTVTFDGIKPSEAAIVDDNTQAYAFDIKVTNLKDNLAGDQLVTVIVTAPNALAAMKAYHNGTLIEDAVYDEVEGTITFKTANFSPYDFTSQIENVSDLEGLRAALQKEGHTAKLTANIEVDLTKETGKDRDINHAYVGSNTYYNGVMIKGKNVGLDLNGYNITALCGDNYNSNSDVGALFFVGENGSLNITNTGNVSTGFIKMRSSIYAVWAPFNDPSYVDIYGGAFIGDSYADDPIGTSTDPDSKDGTMQNENSNRALIYAGFGGNMRVLGGYFLYNNTPNDISNRNNGAFNAKDFYEGNTPLLTIHDGVMLINKEYRQNPANTSQPNGSYDNYSVKLEANCGIKKVENRGVTIDGVYYPTWYRVSSDVPVSLEVMNLKDSYAVGDSLNLTVRVKYSYGFKTLSAGEYTIQGADMSTVGVKNVTFTYTEYGETVSTQVTFRVVGIINITVEPVKDVFKIGDTIDRSNFKVYAGDNLGGIVEINDFQMTTVNTSTAGDKTVTVTYGDYTATCTVAVKQVYTELDPSQAELKWWNNEGFRMSHFWEPIYSGKTYYTLGQTEGSTYQGSLGEVATGFNSKQHGLAQPMSGYVGLTVTNAQKSTWVGINGWLGFESKQIADMGYYYDNDPLTYESYTVNGGVLTNGGEYALQYAGQYAKEYFVQTQLDAFELNENHTINWVAVFTDGTMVKLAQWNIEMAKASGDKYVDTTEKPNANVIILAGQSNATGISPLTQSMKARYANTDFGNIFIHYNTAGVIAPDTNPKYYNDGFDQYAPGLGGYVNPYAPELEYIGPELGIAEYIASRPALSSERWYIIKFAVAGTGLADNWFSNQNYANAMLDYVDSAIAELSKTYDVKVTSFAWMQGESDAMNANAAAAYATNEQTLVSMVRNRFAKYSTRSATGTSVPGSGIAFIDAQIAPNGLAHGEYANNVGTNIQNGGPNDWIYASQVNNAKGWNCSDWALPGNATEGSIFTPGTAGGQFYTNPQPKIINSLYFETTSLTNKANASAQEKAEYLFEDDKTDKMHYSTEGMRGLGYLFGSAIEYMYNLYG